MITKSEKRTKKPLIRRARFLQGAQKFIITKFGEIELDSWLFSWCFVSLSFFFSRFVYFVLLIVHFWLYSQDPLVCRLWHKKSTHNECSLSFCYPSNQNSSNEPTKKEKTTEKVPISIVKSVKRLIKSDRMACKHSKRWEIK